MSRTQSVAETLTALQSGDIEKAVTLSNRYSGREGSLYEHDTVALVRTILEHDYTPDPRLSESILAPLRVLAAATELWGMEEAEDYIDISGHWHFRYEPAEALRLLHDAGLEKHRLNAMAAMGVERVCVRFLNRSCVCSVCRKIKDRE
ncbi:MAG: hypothetical protein HKN82_17660, partial [Akkermansiaceae bacterium]|nr:hypothetical protein [Akkermansiaceae bacterium]